MKIIAYLLYFKIKIGAIERFKIAPHADTVSEPLSNIMASISFYKLNVFENDNHCLFTIF